MFVLDQPPVTAGDQDNSIALPGDVKLVLLGIITNTRNTQRGLLHQQSVPLIMSY